MYPWTQAGHLAQLLSVPLILIALIVKWWPNPLLTIMHIIQLFQLIFCLYRYENHKWSNQWQFFVLSDVLVLVEILCFACLVHDTLLRCSALACAVWVYEIMQTTCMYTRFLPIPSERLQEDSWNTQPFQCYSLFHAFYLLDAVALIGLLVLTIDFSSFWFYLGWLSLLLVCTLISAWLPRRLDYQAVIHHACLGIALGRGISGRGNDLSLASCLLVVACSQILWNVVASTHIFFVFMNPDLSEPALLDDDVLRV